MNPAGYLLSEKSVRQVREALYTHARRLLNPRYTQPDDKIDHEEFHTTEFHIARTPSGGIPALQSMGSTGIGDIPGSAECYVFKSYQNATELADFNTDIVGALKLRVLNLSDQVIGAEQWILIVRDKYGQWYAVNPPGETLPPPPPPGVASGPGWVAGLSNEDCLEITVLGKNGKCSTIDATQVLTLTSTDGETWISNDVFEYSGGSGLVEFTRPLGQSMPNLAIDGFDLIYEGAGTTGEDNEHYIDFAGGTSLCGDPPGTGSGTGTARTACGSNIFIVRVMCVPCPTDTVVTFCSPDRDLPRTMYLRFSNGTGSAVCLNGLEFEMTVLVEGISWRTDALDTVVCGGDPISNGIGISCDEGNGMWTISASGNLQSPANPLSFSPNGPFAVVTGPATPFNTTKTVTVSNATTGTIDITISET